MSRQVITPGEIGRNKVNGHTPGSVVETTQPLKADLYTDRLLKYIPAEVVACYIFVQGVITQLTDPVELGVFQWSIFAVFLILTYLYLWRILKVRKFQQLAISVTAFAVWVFALGGPFALVTWYKPVYGEVLLRVFTLIVALWSAEK